MIHILNLGWGNLESFQRFILKLGYLDKILTLSEINLKAKYNTPIIIPGIGSAKKFNDLSEKDRFVLNRILSETKCVIGVCLGSHLLCGRSDEGGMGVGMVGTDIMRFKNHIPNIGYVKVTYANEEYIIYHCHNYFIPKIPSTVSGNFENEEFYTTIAEINNMTLIQGHPEKSGEDGERLIKCVLRNHGVFHP